MEATVKPKTEAHKRWNKVYSEGFMTMWYPHEDIIRFCARLIQRKLTHDRYEVKRKVERVLDLGCGNGRNAMYFARQGFSASGLDVSTQAIEWAKDWSKREGLEIDFRVGDIEQLPFENETFDVVVSHGVLDHVPMPTARNAATEVHRVLKPGGLFYCDLRSTEDFEFGEGEEVAPNTFVVSEGFEQGLVQHFFSEDETKALFDGLFGIIYSEIAESRLGPDFKRKYSRWVFATEKL
ncbi:MAG TPA: class I SAM-dependent methyltransferase [Pyrinomonadaceae bacterium]|nr:class I SAM-dependent methyltransferase [Pyrinomonadaceae bacterium]